MIRLRGSNKSINGTLVYLQRRANWDDTVYLQASYRGLEHPPCESFPELQVCLVARSFAPARSNCQRKTPQGEQSGIRTSVMATLVLSNQSRGSLRDRVERCLRVGGRDPWLKKPTSGTKRVPNERN
jgi:hypothetical protein